MRVEGRREKESEEWEVRGEREWKEGQQRRKVSEGEGAEESVGGGTEKEREKRRRK